MRKYRYDIVQNEDEWYQIKIGKMGASAAPDILMAPTTKGYQGLIDRLVEERITGAATESKTFVGNAFTNRGHEFEPIAREDYEIRNLCTVDIVGVVELDDWVLCSPDGLIGEDGVHQIKCPIFNTQRSYLKVVETNKGLSDNEMLKKIDGSYYKQCQMELYVTDRKYNVWTSFHPHLPPIDLRLERDEILIEEIKSKIEQIKQQVEIEILTIKR